MRQHPPEPTHSEHSIDAQYRESDVFDVDGPSVSQAENTDGDVLVVIRKVWFCNRDHCDASTTKDHVYSYSDVSEHDRETLQTHFESTGTELCALCAENVVVVDHDSKHPYIGIDVGDETVGYVAPQWSETDSAFGGCNGTVDEATRLGI